MNRYVSYGIVLGSMCLAVGCGTKKSPISAASSDAIQERLKAVRLHFEGFTKSKSGATWMAWPNKVKEALVGLQAVAEVRMELERDQFVVTYDASRVTVKDLIAASEKTGFPATVVEDGPSLSDVPRFFQDALDRAKKERKPLVVDFTASWCAPCQKMLRKTFPNPLVANLLDERCVFVTVDTDEHPGLAQKYGVVGLPDIRFLTPDGQEVQRQRDFQDAEAFSKTLQNFLAQVTASEQADELMDLLEGDQNLRDVFNRDHKYVRLLLILSPT